MPAAFAPVVGTEDAPAQVDAPQGNYGAAEGPSFPPPPAHEPETPVVPENIFFLEPNLKRTPDQVHDNNYQPGVYAQGTVNSSTAMVDPSIYSAVAQWIGAHSQVHAQGQATETRTGPQLPCITFDSYGNYRDVPNRRQLTAGDYYQHLAENSAVPQTRDESRENLQAIAQSTPEQPITSNILIPGDRKTPGIFILKRRYPDRSKGRQPGPTFDVSSAHFHFRKSTSYTIQNESKFLHVTLSGSQKQVSLTEFCLTYQCQLGLQSNSFEPFRNYLNYGKCTLIDFQVHWSHFLMHQVTTGCTFLTKRCFSDKPIYSVLQQCLCRKKSHTFTKWQYGSSPKWNWKYTWQIAEEKSFIETGNNFRKHNFSR